MDSVPLSRFLRTVDSLSFPESRTEKATLLMSSIFISAVIACNVNLDLRHYSELTFRLGMGFGQLSAVSLGSLAANYNDMVTKGRVDGTICSKAIQ